MFPPSSIFFYYNIYFLNPKQYSTKKVIFNHNILAFTLQILTVSAKIILGDGVKNYIVCSFNKLSELPFYLKEVEAINLVPRLKKLVKNGRLLNGFLYLLDGRVQYTFNGRVQVFSPGTLLYLPSGSVHIYESLTPTVRYVRVDFRLYCVTTGQEILFAESVTPLTRHLSAEIGEKFLCLARLSLNGNNRETLKKQSLLLDILNDCANLTVHRGTSAQSSRILNCIHFVEENCTKPFTLEQLCAFTRLSPTHLRRTFKAATGMSVIKYKNHCRVQLALKLLRTDLPFGEISDTLGFDNENYFSKVFRQYTGLSPHKYRCNL